MTRSIPILPVCSMNLIAYNIRKKDKKIAVILDARREKFYYSLYKRTSYGLHVVRKATLLKPDELLEQLKGTMPCGITGDALRKHRGLFQSIMGNEDCFYPETKWHVNAESFLPYLQETKKKKTITARKLVPSYLRETEAEEKFVG